MNNQEKYTQYLLNKQRRLKALEEFREKQSGEIDPETFGDYECGRVLCEKFRSLIKESKSNERFIRHFNKIYTRTVECYNSLCYIRKHRKASYIGLQIHKTSLQDLSNGDIPESCITYCRNLLTIKYREFCRQVEYGRSNF